MWKKIWRLLSSIAIIISLVVGIRELFLDQYFTGVFVLLICVVLLVILIFEILSAPIVWISTEYHYEIVDSSGKLVKARKVKRFIVKGKNITTLVDRRLSATGQQLRSFETDMGRIVQVTDIGGTITIHTLLEAPLERGKEHTHTIKYEAVNALLNPTESATLDVVHKCRYVGIHVVFPEVRLPRQISAYYIRGSEVSKLAVTPPEGRERSVVVNKPKLGSTVVIEWDW